MDLREIVGTRPLIMTGACVIVIDEKDRILLQLRTDNGMWGLPGGSLEPGETMNEVAKRELFEETGLIADEIDLLEIFSGKDFYYQYPHGDEVYNVIVAYTCRKYQGTISMDEKEVRKLKFFNIQDIPSKINPPDLPIISEFLKRIREVG